MVISSSDDEVTITGRKGVTIGDGSGAYIKLSGGKVTLGSPAGEIELKGNLQVGDADGGNFTFLTSSSTQSNHEVDVSGAFPQDDGARAADDLCTAYAGESGHFAWLAQKASRLIVKHGSEWANPEKWKQLYREIEQAAGPTPRFAEEQKRIEKLVWWDEVKAKVPGFPAPDVFHIHPVGLVGNFLGGACACEGQEISLESLRQIAPQAGETKLQKYLPALNQAFVDFKFDSCITRTHFIAQMLTENGQFRYTKETGAGRK